MSDYKKVIVKKTFASSFLENVKTDELINMDHCNVLKVLAIEQDFDYRYIVLEFCVANLRHVIDQRIHYKGPVLPSDYHVLYQIASGLSYIHSKGFIYRSVKLENILITENATLKVSDFGLPKYNDDWSTVLFDELSQMSSWLPPEFFKMFYKKTAHMKWTPESDIFPMGCLFFVYITNGKHPFGDNPGAIEHHVLTDEPVNITDDNKHFAVSIIREMIRHEKDMRPSMEIVKTRLNAHKEDPHNSFQNFEKLKITNDKCSHTITTVQTIPSESYINIGNTRISYSETDRISKTKFTIVDVGFLHEKH